VFSVLAKPNPGRASLSCCNTVMPYTTRFLVEDYTKEELCSPAAKESCCIACFVTVLAQGCKRDGSPASLPLPAVYYTFSRQGLYPGRATLSCCNTVLLYTTRPLVEGYTQEELSSPAAKGYCWILCFLTFFLKGACATELQQANACPQTHAEPRIAYSRAR